MSNEQAKEFFGKLALIVSRIAQTKDSKEISKIIASKNYICMMAMDEMKKAGSL
jgi:hypothetical protein